MNSRNSFTSTVPLPSASMLSNTASIFASPAPDVSAAAPVSRAVKGLRHSQATARNGPWHNFQTHTQKDTHEAASTWLGSYCKRERARLRAYHMPRTKLAYAIMRLPSLTDSPLMTERSAKSCRNSSRSMPPDPSASANCNANTRPPNARGVACAPRDA